MGKSRPRAPVASLNSMASRVRDQKATSATKASGPGGLQNANKNQKFTKDSSSSDNDSSDSEGSDTGSDSDVEAARKKYAAKQASKRKDTQPKANVAKSNATKSPANAKASSPAKPSSKATTSESDDSESDSDTSSQDSVSGKIPAQTPAAKDGKKSKSKDESGSESESSSESESESEAEEASAQQPAKSKSGSSSDSDSDSGSSSASEKSSYEDAPDRMDVDRGETAISRVNGDATPEDSSSQVSSRPAWLNSSNFVLRKASSDNPGKEVSEFLSKTNLEGKQVWYFTAPASLPITVLKEMEIDLSKAATGEALLKHNGDDYGIELESHATSTQIQLLIPSQAGDNYTALNRAIDSTIHLRRMAKFGPGNTISATAADNYAPVPKAIREQPQGLKPRFTPIGVPTPTPTPVQSLKPQPTPAAKNATSSESESESESDSDEETTAVTKPQPPTSSGSSKKSQKPTAVNGERKRKHPGDEGAKSAPVQNPQSSEKSAKRPKTSKPASTKASSSAKNTPAQTQTTPMPNGTPSKGANSSSKPEKKKKYAIKPVKETPVPLPTVLSMKR
ncbi:hypothetical protein K449DRAFT_402289 [Hypoxylon sp. EC38]|nr:hypothetical protein K449DRAFT_402289 [Hypoxylon sp. EC38]